MAVLAPMPSASESTATTAKRGLRRKPRSARRMSWVGSVIRDIDGAGRRRVGTLRWPGRVCDARIASVLRVVEADVRERLPAGRELLHDAREHGDRLQLGLRAA